MSYCWLCECKQCSDNADEDSGVGTSIIGGFAVLVPVVLVVAVVVAAAFVGLDGRGDAGD